MKCLYPTAESGISAATARHGLGVVISDLDNDRDLDIYVTNDRGPASLWRNDGSLEFVEADSDAAAESVVVSSAPAGVICGTGVDAADYDGDGRFDLLVGGCADHSTRLYRNAAIGPLELRFEAAPFPEAEDPVAAWGTKFLDYDNDGRVDGFLANGPRLYRNEGDGILADATATSGLGAGTDSGRSAAVADLDRNGSLDLVVLNQGAPPTLWLNHGTPRTGWLSIELVGRNANRDGVGARLELSVGGRILVREANPFGSFRSQSSYRIHFGMGEHTSTDQLVVHWPSGHSDLITGLEAGLFYTVEEQVGVIAETGPGGW